MTLKVWSSCLYLPSGARIVCLQPAPHLFLFHTKNPGLHAFCQLSHISSLCFDVFGMSSYGGVAWSGQCDCLPRAGIIRHVLFYLAYHPPKILIKFSIVLCVGVWAYEWKSENNLGGQLSPSISWVRGIKIRLSSFLARTFTQSVILLLSDYSRKKIYNMKE